MKTDREPSPTAPVGSQRLKPPTPYNTTFGVFNATNPPNACPQFYNPNGMTGNYSAGALQPLIQAFVVPTVPESEDCLTVNVYRPSNISSNGSLPVMFWMYGGGFEVSIILPVLASTARLGSGNHHF